MKAGDKILVEAFKADGTRYRYWEATLEIYTADYVVTVFPAGGPVFDLQRGIWIMKHIMRSYYWFDKPYNLIEAFEPGGRLMEIYINVASLPWLKDGKLGFTDHELDVSAYPPAPARLVDEDEFAEAIEKYGYTPEFQREMYRVAAEALEIANHWQAGQAPVFGGEDAQ